VCRGTPAPAAAWSRLTALAEKFEPDLRGWFDADPGRVERYTFRAGDLHVDLSKSLLDNDVLAALLALPCSATGEEPPTQLRIAIDGRQYVTTAGTSLEVDVGGRKATLRIDELPWRHFSQDSLQFDYPRHFPWESDPAQPRSWTLDGNDSVIMVFEQSAGHARSPEDVAAGFEKTLGAKAPAEHAKAVLRTERVGTLTGVNRNTTTDPPSALSTYRAANRVRPNHRSSGGPMTHSAHMLNRMWVGPS
jgi:hypothetical protein